MPRLRQRDRSDPLDAGGRAVRVRAVRRHAAPRALPDRHHLQGIRLLPERLASSQLGHRQSESERSAGSGKDAGEREPEKSSGSRDAEMAAQSGSKTAPTEASSDLGGLRLARAAPAAEASVRREGEPALATALHADLGGRAGDLARRCLPERALQRGHARASSAWRDGGSPGPIWNLRTVGCDRALARIAESELVELRAACGQLGGVRHGGRRGSSSAGASGIGGPGTEGSCLGSADRHAIGVGSSADRLRLGLDLGHHRLRLGLGFDHGHTGSGSGSTSATSTGSGSGSTSATTGSGSTSARPPARDTARARARSVRARRPGRRCHRPRRRRAAADGSDLARLRPRPVPARARPRPPPARARPRPPSASSGSGSTSATTGSGSGSTSATTGSGSGSGSTSASTGSGSGSAGRIASTSGHALDRVAVGCDGFVGRQVGGGPDIEAEPSLQVVLGELRVRHGGRCDGGCGQAFGQVIGPGNRRAASTPTGGVVPAVDAGVLAAVDAEVERLVECVELGGGEVVLLGAHGVAHRVGERVLAGQVVAQSAEQPPRLAQGVEPRGGLEFVSRPAAFAKGLGERVNQG